MDSKYIILGETTYGMVVKKSLSHSSILRSAQLMKFRLAFRNLAARKRLWLSLAMLAALLIIAGSLLPIQGSHTITHQDKITHLIAYAGLGGLFIVGLSAHTYIKQVAIVWAGVTVYGIMIEFLQAVLNTGREGSALDALANGIGAAIGIAIAVLILRGLKIRSN